tara:strand:+ start:891 stop:1043 length:153 start_codon:yes stop_codon:yes gene_type:complete
LQLALSLVKPAAEEAVREVRSGDNCCCSLLLTLIASVYLFINLQADAHPF